MRIATGFALAMTVLFEIEVCRQSEAARKGGLVIYMAAVSALISSSESWVIRPSSTR